MYCSNCIRLYTYVLTTKLHHGYVGIGTKKNKEIKTEL